MSPYRGVRPQPSTYHTLHSPAVILRQLSSVPRSQQRSKWPIPLVAILSRLVKQAAVVPRHSIHQLPFNDSQDRTNTKPWQTQPPRSSLSLVESRLPSTLSRSLVASSTLFWPGALEIKAVESDEGAIRRPFNMAFELVRGAGLTPNQAYAGHKPVSPTGYESRKLHVEHVFGRGAMP